MEKRPALGKGLSALIPDASDMLTAAAPRASMEVDIELLEPNTYQPRGPIDSASLEELAKSIRAIARCSAPAPTLFKHARKR